ncbi:MAG TPA: HAMP domain-containing histidine kinase [Planctomycetes bacterium]|nr:HAMP domain-containing histidine kinase [Planctomycetota bacterium]
MTAFNVVVFGGLLVWFTHIISEERAELAQLDEQLVLERLRNLLDEQGQALTGEILSWSRWSRYEDAQIVQLRSFEASGGLLSDLRRVGLSGRTEFVPDGVLIPLRRPRPAPRNVTVPVTRSWVPTGRALPPVLPSIVGYSLPMLLGAARVRLNLPRMEPGEVWGAGLMKHGAPWPSHPHLAFCAPNFERFLAACVLWPLHVRKSLSTMVFLGLSPARQRGYDRDMSAYLREALISAQRAEISIRFRGGLLLPLTRPAGDSAGEIWGAGFFPFPTWLYLMPGPFFSPAKWMTGAIIDPLEEDPSPADLRLGRVYLNPMGSAHRSPLWDQEAVLSQIRQAATEGDPVGDERGLAVPLRLASGELWGGVWLRPREDPIVRPILRQLGPWFLLSTVMLTLATFFGVHRLVLDPVRRLAQGARRLRMGDLTARVPEVRRRDELADLVRSFNGMAEKLEGFNARLATEVQEATAAAREAEAAAMTQRRLAATGELAAGIAHEINNPLGGMLNALEVLGRPDLDPETRERYLELVQGGLERIGETVGKVLRLAPRETAVEPLALVGPLGDALGLIQHRADVQGTQMWLEGEGGARLASDEQAFEAWSALPLVRGQRNELGQAILNLLVNSLDALVDHASGEGRIRVGLESEGEWLRLWVVDNGPGMDADLIQRAADLFYTTKDTGRGTGLGLAIVHNVVNGHGGEVQLRTPPEGGFLVELRLPVYQGGEPSVNLPGEEPS